MLSGLPANIFNLQKNMISECRNHRLQTDPQHHDDSHITIEVKQSAVFLSRGFLN